MEHTHTLNWQAHEYNHTEKGRDWYWALWIIVCAVGATAILFGNVLLAVLIVVGGIALSLYAARKPLLMEYMIDDRGITVGGTVLFPFAWLDAFNIERGNILIKQKKTVSTLLMIPLGEMDGGEVRALLKQHLLEEEIEEPLSQILMEWLGF